MDSLYEKMMECICSNFCKCREDTCDEDSPCYLEDALKDVIVKHLSPDTPIKSK